MKSYKNILQEYCQKNNIKLPTYNSLNLGQSHDPIWKSSIDIMENKYFSKGGSLVIKQKQNKIPLKLLVRY
jgi:hypothetical protein